MKIITQTIMSAKNVFSKHMISTYLYNNSQSAFSTLYMNIYNIQFRNNLYNCVIFYEQFLPIQYYLHITYMFNKFKTIEYILMFKL